MKVYLGIDTSCYTTSAALFAENGQLVGDERRILKVKPGNCGLQQQEMLYQHIRALPELLETLVGSDMEIKGICVSGRPRPLAESYMPAFLAGLSVARSLAIVGHCSLLVQSHQENHLQAALWSSGGIKGNRFLFMHVSGGTTDVLLAEGSGTRYTLTQVGGSMDLHAGQFVDRVGVALGLQFPAGAALERLALQAAEPEEIPVSLQKNQLSFSGPCSAALRKLQAGADPAALALGVEQCLGLSFGRLLRKLGEEYAVRQVLLAGGVAENQYIRRICGELLSKRGMFLHGGEPRFSCDGAVGNAYTSWLQFGVG